MERSSSRRDVVAALAQALRRGSRGQGWCPVVSARPGRQGCPRASALRGLDSGLASTGELVRQPLAALARRARVAVSLTNEVAVARRARVAVSLTNEVAVNRASDRNALEAHRK